MHVTSNARVEGRGAMSQQMNELPCRSYRLGAQE
jgi:hypothetical protein